MYMCTCYDTKFVSFSQMVCLDRMSLYTHVHTTVTHCTCTYICELVQCTNTPENMQVLRQIVFQRRTSCLRWDLTNTLRVLAGVLATSRATKAAQLAEFHSPIPHLNPITRSVQCNVVHLVMYMYMYMYRLYMCMLLFSPSLSPRLQPVVLTSPSPSPSPPPTGSYPSR